MSKTSLFDNVNEQEQEQQPVKKADISKPTTNPAKKKVVIQIRIDQYEKFKAINEARNVSTNSIWNMLMNNYIKENEHLL